MRHITEVEPVAALKALLHDLEKTTLIFPDDISILSLRRDLRARIAPGQRSTVAHSEDIDKWIRNKSSEAKQKEGIRRRMQALTEKLDKQSARSAKALEQAQAALKHSQTARKHYSDHVRKVQGSKDSSSHN